MKKIKTFSAKTVNLPNEDIDTDQIIPARFLTRQTIDGIGECLFADWRYDKSGKPNENFILNQAESANSGILVAGNNFGCGSSREHAAWSLLDYGFRAVVSSSFADIFQNNSLKNGLITIAVDLETHEWLMQHPATELIVDLENTEIILETGKTVSFPIDSFARYCLLNGVDQLGYILSHESEIKAYENQQQ
ncbi:MAG: 3-isopropylmalate dehydratase small subunit [Gammaproteobacteria bacterium]|nr:3-isopropylmalate dehydratase small subunit [Gammaproteobacteria bacterium]|tara:strand:- start:2848 stop:3423 length:576 start_codon:yes stop_codon:yes gene_type:complete